MSEPIETGDGCDIPQSEVLGLLQLGLKTDRELHPDFPSAALSPTDRGLLLLTLSDLPEAKS